MVGSGFSFADLSADIAGIQFANAVADGRIPLSRLESRFTVRDFLPDASGLKEGIAWKDFVKQYGFSHGRAGIARAGVAAKKVLAMPGYKGAP